MQDQSTTPVAPTVYALGYALRNALLGDATTCDAAGALTLLVMTRAALTLGSARRRAALKRDPRTPRMRAADKARALLSTGAYVLLDGPAALVQSTSRAGVVHRVEARRCTCEVGQLGRPCWHVETVAQERTARAARRVFRVASTLAALRARQLAA